jgi:hypothetical protein
VIKDEANYLRLQAFEASPSDVRLSPFINPRTIDDARNENITFATQFVAQYSPPYVAPSGSPVFPIPGHVRFPDQYGPLGNDYQGTEILPATSKVRTGTNYGAAGSEFSGNEQIPVPADVKNGVGYGDGGTEFTGTLVAGGGSGGVSRGRTVN